MKLFVIIGWGIKGKFVCKHQGNPIASGGEILADYISQVSVNCLFFFVMPKR